MLVLLLLQDKLSFTSEGLAAFLGNDINVPIGDSIDIKSSGNGVIDAKEYVSGAIRTQNPVESELVMSRYTNV